MTPARRKAEPVPANENAYVEARRRSRRLIAQHHPSAPVIDKNVPIPTTGARGGLRKFDHFYPFELMEPGDSFWVPGSTQCTAGAVTKFAKKSGWKFMSRGQGQDGTANKELPRSTRGVRVWRIA